MSPFLTALPPLAAFLGWDLASRRVPNWLVAVGFAYAVLTSRSPWNIVGLALGGGILLLADYPAGDLKAGAVLGWLLGLTIAPVLALAMTANLIAWSYGVTRMPFLLYIALGFSIAFALTLI